MTQFNAVGLRSISVTGVDSAGYAVGGNSSGSFSGVAAAAGAMVDAHKLYGAFSMPSAIPEPNRIFPLGDDGVVGVYQFPATELPSGTMQLSAEDQDFIAYIQATNTVTLGTDWTHGLTNPTDQGFLDCYVIVHKQGLTVPGNLARWKTEVFYGNASFLGQDSNHQGLDYYNYSVAYKRMAQYPWGVAFVNGTEGTTAAGSFGGYNPYPWMLANGTGDNSETQFDLDYTPYEASGDAVLVWVNGTLKTYTTDYTVDVGNKQINFVAAPAASAKIGVWYGFTDWG